MLECEKISKNIDSLAKMHICVENALLEYVYYKKMLECENISKDNDSFAKMQTCVEYYKFR